MTKNRPQIVHIVNTLPPYWSGTGIVAWNLTRALTESGKFDVSIVTPLTKENRNHDYETVLVRKQRALIRLGQAPFTPEILTIYTADLMHLHFPYYFGAELTLLNSMIRRIPYIITYHNDVLKKGFTGMLTSSHSRWLVPIILKNAACICVMSDRFLKISPVLSRLSDSEKIIVIPQGIDTGKFRRCKQNDSRYEFLRGEKYILFVRSLDPAHHHSGLSFLLAALPKISTECSLVVVGDGPLRVDYEKEARDLGVNDRVRFLGSIDNRELPALYSSAQAFVLPSSETENASLVLMEAMACGIPVVASDIGGTGAMIRHNIDGLLIKPRDPDAISAAVNFLLENPGKAAEMGDTTRKHVEMTSSWKIIASRYEEVYEKVLCASA